MKIAVTLSSADPKGMVEERFGRCAAFWIYDDETKEGRLIENTAANRSNGAGVDASRIIIKNGVTAVITGRLGPNASEALKAAKVVVYNGAGYSAQDSVNALFAGVLNILTDISPGHQ